MPGYKATPSSQVPSVATLQLRADAGRWQPGGTDGVWGDPRPGGLTSTYPCVHLRSPQSWGHAWP